MKKSRHAILVAFSLLGLVCLGGGCGSPPTAVERHLFTITTNETPTVQTFTNTVWTTNIVEGVPVPGAELVTTFKTNIAVDYTYTANTNAAALQSTVQNVGNLFGPYGALAGGLFLGALAVWGKMRSGKTKAETGNAVLAQSIETLLQIIETTPQGKLLTDRLKVELAKNQIAAGVLNEIAVVVETQVDNEQAKAVARHILAQLPAA